MNSVTSSAGKYALPGQQWDHKWDYKQDYKQDASGYHEEGMKISSSIGLMLA